MQPEPTKILAVDDVEENLTALEALLADEVFDERLGNQGVLLLDQGCGDTYQLITAGKWAGEVWNFCDVGAGPCCEHQDFLGWLELWVDSDFDADFFKDYE